jgi:Tol biopolymer transport system component
VNVGTGKSTVIVSSTGILDRPDWRPDGRYIAYGAEIEGNWDIYVISRDGSETHRLTHDAQMESNPLWSSDGNLIAYKVAPNKAYNLTLENFITVKDGLDNPKYYLWDGTKSIQMNDWSGNGKMIAYTAEAVTNSSGEDRVTYLAVTERVFSAPGKTSGTPVVLSAGETLGDRGTVFSPDGNRVAFWGWDTDYRATLWVVGSDGSHLRRLTEYGHDMYPQWHPGGEVLLFESARSGNFDIWTVVVD